MKYLEVMSYNQDVLQSVTIWRFVFFNISSFSFQIIGFFLLCEMVNDVGIFMFSVALYTFKSNVIRYVSLLFATEPLPLWVL